eukprot:TRINITY_DN63763_c0_g4_i1.p1 TRINITY_DN63763_c0_g4~~TRINITY_DN63763_c0_g4_i1.p1  ORF type:complete len:118 (+),score=34.83 TRINITY_DN63763_c0_g4_i1:96-449(+)
MAFYEGQKDEFVVSMACLALYDGGAEITADAINALVKNSNNTCQPYWPSLFSGLMKDGKVEELVFTGSQVSSGGAVNNTSSKDDDAKEEQKEAPKKEEEVDALEGGMSMFGGDGGDY